MAPQPSDASTRGLLDESEDGKINLYPSDRTSWNSLKSPRRFEDSTHLIPPPGWNGVPPERFEPLLLRLPVIVAAPLGMFLLGIGLEIVTALSNAFGGFKVSRSSFPTVFGTISAQFLASFFPTFMILPTAFLWRELDWMLRSYQPYITLKRGNAKAEESLLLDYIELGPVLSLPRAWKYRHRIIFFSSLTASLTYFFQPLTGSILQIRQTPQTAPWSVTSLQTVSLAPDISNMQAFLAAAGYVDAAVVHGLGDPEFVSGGWATSRFTFPTNPMLNATLSLQTIGIRSVANCSNPVEPPTVTPEGTRLTLSSKSIDGCVHSVVFDSSTGQQQSGVDAVPCPGNAAQLDVSLRPVMFWFYNTDPKLEARTVFCTPILTGNSVLVKSSVSRGTIISVEKLPGIVPSNTVLNGDQAGKVFNGVVFPLDPNAINQARANATNLIVPSAIFRSMTQQPGGLDAVFAKPNGVLDSTSRVYTQHLSMTAKSIYFVNANSTLPAELVSIEPRLWVDPLPAHLLASVLMLTGFLGIFLHVMNRRQRRQLQLASQPGSIASIVSLTSHSGWGQLLSPYDSEQNMEKKLDGLRFSLDKRTGAIVADDDGSEVTLSVAEMRMSLLSQSSPSSSALAFQTAAGYKPWLDPSKNR